MNYAQENEYYLDPCSIFIEAGMNGQDFVPMCTLDLIDDQAFSSVSNSVFGKNMGEFCKADSDSRITLCLPKDAAGKRKLDKSINKIIKDKVDSVLNFKALYLRFCFRRSVMSCVENSPLSSRIQMNKNPLFAINFISIIGYDMKQVAESYTNLIVKSQKKIAMEVMSVVCQTEFCNALKVISNETKTIEKIKQQFSYFCTQVSLNNSKIEQILISMSQFNVDLGDWVITKLLERKGSP